MNEVDTDALVSALKREYDDAEDFYTNVLLPEVEAANAYFDARPFGDEMDGRSQIVMPDVAEAIEYMTVSILRLFLSSERVVEIEAISEEDEAGADEATAAVHFNFMREQDGSRVLTDWAQGGLLERISVVKTCAETEERIIRERFQIDPMQAQAYEAGMLPLPDGAEIEDVSDNGDGSLTVQIKTTRKQRRYRDLTIPLEEFRVSRNARHEDDADYIAHVCLKPRYELVAMGFDRDQVDALPVDSELDTSRFDWQEHRDSNELSPELQTVIYCHEFVRMDVDGDGIAELAEVHRVGDEILKDAKTGELALETVEENPFAVFCPFPRAHRLVGNSLADKTMDLQRIRSIVARQMQDAMYIANMPRPLVDMSNDYAATTLDDILRPIPGSPIRYKGAPPMPFQAGADVSKSLSVLEYWAGERETRTGITRLNQGLDAETLNKTATGAALMASQGQQLEEAVARRFGEAFARLLAKKVRLMRNEGAQYPIKIDGQYRQANAANWPQDFSLNIRVGLGTGRKEQRLQYLFALGNVMERAVEIGAVDSKGIYRLGSEIVQAMQLGQGDDYFVNPEQMMPEQQGPDPQQARDEAQMQLEAAKVQAKVQGDQTKAGMKAQTDRERMMMEAQLRREEMDQEAQLAVLKMATQSGGGTQISDAAPGGSLAR